MAGRRNAFAGIGAAAVLVLTGCGGDDDGSQRTVTVGASEPVEVVGTEYAFDPATIVVEKGGRLELVFANEGSIAHNLVVLEDETEVGGTPTFQGGESRAAEIELDPGSYRMVCTVADHEELGMVGQIEVR